MKTEKTINQLITDFIDDCDVLPRSKYQYQNSLDKYFFYLLTHKIDCDKAKRVDVICYKNFLISQGKTCKTIDSYLTSVRMFYSYLEAHGIYENIAAGIKSPNDNSEHRKGYLKNNLVSKMLEAMPKETITDFRNFAIVNLMVRSALRRIELVRLNIEDIKEVDGEYIAKVQRKFKISKNEELGLTAKSINPLHEYLSLRKSATGKEPMFLNHSRFNSNERLDEGYISKIVKDAFKLIGINDPAYTCHSLRHTAAISALNSGATVEQLKNMLGHSKIETTLIYIKAVEAENKIINKAVQLIDTCY